MKSRENGEKIFQKEMDGLPVEVVTLLKCIFGANVLNIYSYVQLLDF
jgi:hypothetical protein